ncbi:MAG TPA: hypothetical protein VLS52_05295 [Rudaea sp.]|nr:hypothetical protein [Rudaea sp.]
MAEITVCAPAGPLIVSEFWATAIEPVVSVIVLQADVSTVLLFAAVEMMSRSVPTPLSPQLVTLMATQVMGAASANTLATQAAIGLRRTSAREVESNTVPSPNSLLLVPQVYEQTVWRVREMLC